MLDKGARHLVLVDLGEPDSAESDIVAELAQEGARVEAVRADVSCEADMARIISMIDQSMPPLRGVVHSAGVLDDDVLLEQSWNRFVNVLAPKVEGAWILHRLTLNRKLDFFVLFSSAGSLLESPGQGNHVAASVFLDVLARHRQRIGLPALSIDWGTWSEIGGAAERNVTDQAATRGIGLIAPEEGLEALEMAFQSASAQLGIVPVEWSTFLGRFAPGKMPGFYSDLASPDRVDTAQSDPLHEQTAFLTRWKEAQPSRRRDLLLGFIHDLIVEALGLDPGTPIDQRQPLGEIGLDSLMAVNVRNLLSEGLGLPRKLPATLLFDYPTIGALADYIAHEQSDPGDLAEQEDGQAGQHVEQPTPDSSDLDALTDEEAEALLLEQFSEIRRRD
jgi:polyketide synthase 12/myxalamid-type polyketide synthase MxaB